VLADLSTRELKREIGSLRGELRKLGRFGPLIGSSEGMQRLYDFLPRIAASDASVLVLGETGTGKDLVAQAIHSMSRRAKEAFVPVNCGAVSPTLIEAKLFGHERGSFTGADRSHRASSSARTAARCSSTRSPRCRPSCRSSCCACWRRGRSTASAAPT
jgi:transcriptional regulator with PAS, ATPase and Fis domain